MGICLDTEQSDGSQAFEEGRETWADNSARNPRPAVTPVDGQFPMHNAANLQFESPKVPVIFILGGPGSGKVTHCDNLMQEKTGLVHINMTDLLQQYAIGNDGYSGLIGIGNGKKDMQDFSLLSSKTVTEVLMLEMKMAPQAKTYLVSGYPRNMRDVVEYSEKIQVVNGVILISWRQKVLERQIDYGAKLGQVVLSLARMELNNFYKHVMPVADYFDQSGMLVAINGERNPSEVYKDFRSDVMKILGMQDNPPVFNDGPEASIPTDVTTELPLVNTLPPAKSRNTIAVAPQKIEAPRPQTQVLSVNREQTNENHAPIKTKWPAVLWVIGGPGSNKAALCEQATKQTNWAHISVGRLLRAAADSPDRRAGSDASKIRESIMSGEMVPLDIVMKLVDSHIAANINYPGIILDGFPRDILQATEFESRFKQKPTIILLDCSKLQLGRGRLDDNVTAFRRRLEIFRQSSLPMLKAMDNIGRLTIVDGDTDSAPVQEDFKNVVKEHIQYIMNTNAERAQVPNGVSVPNGHAVLNGNSVPNGTIANGHVPHHNDVTLHDLETEPVQTISKGVGHLVNGFANGMNHNATNGIAHMGHDHLSVKAPGVGNGTTRNKYADLDAERQDNIRQMYGEVNMEGHM